MAFPYVAATATGRADPASNTYVMAMPDDVGKDDLLLIWLHYSGDDSGQVHPSGWTLAVSRGVSDFLRARVYWRIAGGTEVSATYSKTNPNFASWITMRIEGWDGVAPEFEDSAYDWYTTPDPLSLTPSWGADDTLWIALAAWRYSDNALVSYPTDYTADQTEFGSPATPAASGQRLAMATRALNAASEDPGEFTITSSEYNLGITVAVRAGTSGLDLVRVVPSAAEQLAAALATSHQPRARLVTLTPERAIRTTYDPRVIVLDGSVTFDRAREVRRSASLRLVDADGSLAPLRAGDEFAPGSLFGLGRGVGIGGQDIIDLLGVYEVTSFGASMAGVLSLWGEDPSRALQQPFGELATVNAGTPAVTALRQLWEPVLGDGSLWDLDDGAMFVSATRTFAEDDERLRAALALMADLGLEVWMDRNGYPIMRPRSDPNLATVLHTWLQVPGQARATRIERQGDRLPYNRQIVIGEPADGPPVRAVADVTDTASPIHAERIGLRVAPIHRSAQIATQAQANAVARAMLIERSLWSDSVTWSGVPDGRVDAGDVGLLTEERTGTSGRYIVDRVTIPVTLGEMSIVLSPVVPLFEP